MAEIAVTPLFFSPIRAESSPLLQVADMSSSAPSWKRDLEEHGFAIVRGVVTPERASKYVAAAHKWAGQFGWSAEDRSTWNTAHLPAGAAGVVSNYGTAHEKWVWEARMYVCVACFSGDAD